VSETVDALLCDMLAWLARQPRPYGEVMDAWRTSCPRLPVWEDATERGFVEQVRGERSAMVRITPAGRAFLSQRAHRLPPGAVHPAGVPHPLAS
jgi:hypothetical protein